MSVHKLLNRVVTPDISEEDLAQGEADKNHLASRLHDYTHGEFPLLCSNTDSILQPFFWVLKLNFSYWLNRYQLRSTHHDGNRL